MNCLHTCIQSRPRRCRLATSNTSGSKPCSLNNRNSLHRLCARPHTYTQLAQAVAANPSTVLDAALASVAVYQQPKLQERGYYQLRPECWNEFEPYFFWHFKRADLEQVC
jgi:hypothetical protein